MISNDDVKNGQIDSLQDHDNTDHNNPDEETVGGSTPSPESDDDTLANAQAVGLQLGEDEEHPKEVDIARDIDAAEQSLRDK